MIHKYLTFIFTGQSIKFGNYTCLPRSAVTRMLADPAIWSSFSGSLSKMIKDRASIPSIRGLRYFWSIKDEFFFNLIKHSLSIIAVFKMTVLARSVNFSSCLYFSLFYSIFSVVTLIPVALGIILIFSVFVLSKRENIIELNNSLKKY